MGAFKKWRLLRATNFHSLIYPYLFILSVLGFLPYKYGSSIYKYSKTRIAIFMFTLLSYTSALLSVLYYINFTTAISMDVKETISNNLYYLLEGVCVVLHVSYHSFTYGKSTAIEDVFEISTMLSTKEYRDLSKFIHTKDVIAFLILLVHVPHCFTDEIVLTLRNFCDMYTLMINLLIDTIYINFICIVKACFKKLNQSLQEITFILEKNKDHNRISSPLSSQVKFLLLRKLKNVGEKHLEISHAVEGINNAFLIRNIIMTSSTFIVVTFNMYYQLLRMSPSRIVPTAYHNIYWYFPFISPVIFYFVKFAMVTWTCETAVNEARKIKTIIHDVLGNIIDAETKYEAELLSLQILHKDNIFTAKAIDMNAMLLAKVTGGIAMYIMILLQFLLNSALCRKAETS